MFPNRVILIWCVIVTAILLPNRQLQSKICEPDACGTDSGSTSLEDTTGGSTDGGSSSTTGGSGSDGDPLDCGLLQDDQACLDCCVGQEIKCLGDCYQLQDCDAECIEQCESDCEVEKQNCQSKCGGGSESTGGTTSGSGSGGEVGGGSTDGGNGNPDPVTNIAVGIPGGDFEVNGRGGAIYQIPIRLGVANLSPGGIGLYYNSQAGAGELGLGWSISGLSSIERCVKTIAQDGQYRGVKYEKADGYCLNGQRLVLKSGNYGESGSSYTTELESYLRIEVMENDPWGPTSWRITQRDGTKSYYGSTVDSQIRLNKAGESPIRIWAISQSEDVYTNDVEYHYQAIGEAGESSIRYIRYGGNIQGGIPNQLEIEFIYGENNPEDEVPIFRGGGVTYQRKLLSEVQSKANGQIYWRYLLDYIDWSQPRQLKSIEECDGSGLNCLPKTKFQWTLPLDGYDANVSLPGPGTYISAGTTGDSPIENAHLNNGQIRFWDKNGDGILDIYHIGLAEEQINSSDIACISPNQIGGYGDNPLPDEPNTLISCGDGYEKLLMNWNRLENPFDPEIDVDDLYGGYLLNLERFKFVDVNRDGITDLYYVTGFREAEIDRLLIFDKNGGYEEYPGILSFVGPNWSQALEDEAPNDEKTPELARQLAQFDINRFIFLDLNGDNLLDIYYMKGGYADSAEDNLQADEIYYLSYDPDLKEYSYSEAQLGPETVIPNIKKSYMAHYQEAVEFELGVGIGIGGGTPNTVPQLVNSMAASIVDGASNQIERLVESQTKITGFNPNPIKVGDFNGDGLSDILRMRRPGGVIVPPSELYLNTGFGFTDAIAAPLTPFSSNQEHNDYGRVVVGDFNGDGNSDLYFILGSLYENEPEELTDIILFSKGDGSFSEAYPGILSKVVRDFGDDPVRSVAFSLRNLKFADFNSDGKTDIYVINNDENGWGYDDIYYSVGDGNFIKKHGAGMNSFVNSEYIDSSIFDQSTLRFVDFNGDGKIDIYKVDGWGEKVQDTIYLNRYQRPQIKRISYDKEVGRELRIEYQDLTNPEVYQTNNVGEDEVAGNPEYQNVKGGMRVVHQVLKSDGVEGYLGKRYNYLLGKVNTQGRGFMGFRQVYQYNFHVPDPGGNPNWDYFLNPDHQTLYTHTNTQYHQQYPLNGLIEKSYHYVYPQDQASRLVSIDKNFYGIENLSDSKWIYPQIKAVDYFDPDTGEAFRKDRTDILEFDASYGNIKKTKTWIYDETLKLIQIQEVTQGYENDIDDWILGKPTYKKITLSAPDKPKRESYESYQYDAQGFRIETAVASPNYAQSITNNVRHPVYGFLTSSQTTGENIAGYRGYTQTPTEDGKHVKNKTNALGHQVSYSDYDPFFGIAKTTLDANGRSLTQTWNSLGEVTQSLSSTGEKILTEQGWCENNCVSGASYYQSIEKQINGYQVGPVVTSYFDHVGQKIASKTSADSQSIYQRTIYNALGQVVGQSEPSYNPVTPWDPGVLWSSYTYDKLGRKKTISHANNYVQTKYFYEGFNGAGQFITRTEVGYGGTWHISYEKKNRLGQLAATTQINVDDNNQPQELNTEYQYDLLGSISQVIDAQGSIQSTEFNDNTGIKTVIDPNTGTTTSQINALGEVISYQDNAGNLSTYQYDNLGRIIHQDHGDETIDYTYDHYNGKQELGQLQHTSMNYSDSSLLKAYQKIFTYNPSGQIKQIEHQFQAPGEDNFSLYRVSNEYNNRNQLSKTYYPKPYTNFNIEYSYDGFGRINEVKGPGGKSYWHLPKTGVLATGQITEEHYGDYLTRNYAYENQPRRSAVSWNQRRIFS